LSLFALITKHHRLGNLSQWKFISHSSGGPEEKAKDAAEFLSAEGLSLLPK
jgi:hypothetical protein